MIRGTLISAIFMLLLSGCMAGPTPFPQQDATLGPQQPEPGIGAHADAVSLTYCEDDQNLDPETDRCEQAGGDAPSSDVAPPSADADVGPDASDVTDDATDVEASEVSSDG